MGIRELKERDETLARVGRVLELARDGTGGAMFVVAEAGLGKTAVLDRARALAAPGMDVFLARGGEMEGAIPLGLAAQVVPPLGATAIEPSKEPDGAVADPAAPFYRALRWLESRCEGRRASLLLAIDDLHWADADSLRLFAFLARRLEGLPVAMVATLRPWPSPAHEACLDLVDSGDAELAALAPLAPDSVGELLAERSQEVVPADVNRRAWELTGGNPLLVEQVAAALDRGDSLPAPEDGRAFQGEDLLLTRFAGLDPVSLEFARIASVFGTRFRTDLAISAAGLDDGQADAVLDALSRSGLVVDAGEGGLAFSHPLFAQALYGDIAPPVRRRLHARVFRVLAAAGLDDEACEHAIRAELHGDATAIAVCRRAGLSALASGAVVTAAEHLEAAVRFSGKDPAPQLLGSLAEALTACGRVHEAAEVCERLLAGELEWPARIDALRMLGRARYLVGAADHGNAALEEAVAVALAHDSARAVQPLLDQSLTAWLTHGNARALPLTARAREIAAESGDAAAIERATAVWGHVAMESGDPAGLAATEPIGERIKAGDDKSLFDVAELTWPWAPVYQHGMNSVGAERYEEADVVWGKARAVAAEAGAVGSLGTVAIWESSAACRRGRLREALNHAERATEFAEITPGVLGYAALVRAEALLWLGRFDQSAEACAEVEGLLPGQWFAELWLAHIRGARQLWEGDAAASATLLRAEELTRGTGIGEPCHLHWGVHAVSAHLMAGEAGRAREVVAWLEKAAAAMPCTWPRFAAAMGRGRIAENEDRLAEASREFRKACDTIAAVDLPLQRVEALLARGGLMRRSGSPVESRPLLAEAAEIAEEAGAEWLADTAREELSLAGGRRRRRSEDRDLLTAAELRVAKLAAAGNTNAEIAGHLVLSTNTVATHLKHVYAKLGINSRRELAKLQGKLDELALGA